MPPDADMFERFREKDLPAAGEDEEVYLHYLKSLHEPSEHWDRRKGWISWLQGSALNRLMDGIRHKVCKRGAYGRVLQQVGLRTTTAWYCRQIAAQCTADEARTLGHLEMLHRIGAMKGAEDKPVQKRDRRTFIQQIECIRAALNRMKLCDRDTEIAVEDYAPAVEQLTAIARVARKAVNQFERRLKGFRLLTVDLADADKKARRETGLVAAG